LCGGDPSFFLSFSNGNAISKEEKMAGFEDGMKKKKFKIFEFEFELDESELNGLCRIGANKARSRAFCFGVFDFWASPSTYLSFVRATK